MAGTFISYRREDTAGYAGRLRESLERRLGASRVFRDVDTLRPGQDFVQAINATLASCRIMLVVIGREWISARHASGTPRLEDPDDFVRIEVAAALARPDVLVVPVLVEGAAMPSAADLPENLRMLARRQAISVRDETWDADLDRLVALIDDADPSAAGLRPPPPAQRSPARIGATAAVVLVLLVAGMALWRGWRSDAPEMATETTTQSAGNSSPSTSSATGSAYPIAIPAVAQAAFGDLVYTLTSATVTPRGADNELELRVKFSNGGRYDANFWDSSFRLVSGGETIAPTSGLNEVVAGNSTREGRVIFPIAPGSGMAVLRVLNAQATADIPLTLEPSQAPASNAPAKEADRPLQIDPAPLLQTDGVQVVLMRATTRQFANTLRLELEVRFTNRGRYPMASTSIVMRVAIDDDLIAPWDFPSLVIDASSMASGRVVFDLPPAATRATLHTSSAGMESTHGFDLR